MPAPRLLRKAIFAYPGSVPPPADSSPALPPGPPASSFTRCAACAPVPTVTDAAGLQLPDQEGSCGGAEKGRVAPGNRKANEENGEQEADDEVDEEEEDGEEEEEEQGGDGEEEDGDEEEAEAAPGKWAAEGDEDDDVDTERQKTARKEKLLAKGPRDLFSLHSRLGI